MVQGSAGLRNTGVQGIKNISEGWESSWRRDLKWELKDESTCSQRRAMSTAGAQEYGFRDGPSAQRSNRLTGLNMEFICFCNR